MSDKRSNFFKKTTVCCVDSRVLKEEKFQTQKVGSLIQAARSADQLQVRAVVAGQGRESTIKSWWKISILLAT